ncbi:fimbrillin family protein [uncultured Muribaculum sp.]|uniref:fimbrillin family protein n=1 Tax=uncultured Muribaculum sp. TaxID=1918613 RepID=UPI00267473FC|nr:fimbrillin family protein [uncultured Muribaculum sp.]
MNKSLIMLAAAAMSLTACTQSDVIDEGVQSNTIGFNTMVNKGSRAISNDFTQFNVYGNYFFENTPAAPVAVFDGTSVSRADKDATTWSYEGARYWVANARYSFSAYAVDGGAFNTGKGSATYAKDGDNKYVLNITDFICDNTQQKDLVYAAAGSADSPIIGLATGNAVVPFAFKHILSRLDFVFKTNFPDNFKVEISNVSVQDIRNKATFTGKQYAVNAGVSADAVGTWTAPTRDAEHPFANVPFADDVDMTIDNTMTNGIKSGYVYVIPYHYQTLAEGGIGVAVRFTIKVTDPSNNTIINKTLDGRWRPMWDMNKTYTYTVTINGEASGLEKIEFSGSVNDWETGTPANPSFDLGAGELPSIE